MMLSLVFLQGPAHATRPINPGDFLVEAHHSCVVLTQLARRDRRTHDDSSSTLTYHSSPDTEPSAMQTDSCAESLQKPLISQPSVASAVSNGDSQLSGLVKCSISLPQVSALPSVRASPGSSLHTEISQMKGAKTQQAGGGKLPDHGLCGPVA